MVISSPADGQGIPLVTIALPVLNGGRQLILAVRSIVNQTFRNWELLIIDDGSTDNAFEDVLAIQDPRIFFLKDGKNKGLSARLNQAIEIARGQYFARMDHDDICHPERLAKQLEFLNVNTSVDLLSTQYVVIDDNDNLLEIRRSKSSLEDLCARPWLSIPMAHPTWMGRIEWFRVNQYQDPVPYCCDDAELLLRTHKFSRFHCLSEFLLAYRVRKRVSFLKLFRTRIALAWVQINYFAARRHWIYIVFSLSAATARILLDIRRQIGSGVNIEGSKFNYSERDVVVLDEWRAVLVRLKE